VDIQTIDQQFSQLQQQEQQTANALSAIAQKLQAAASAGDQNAREWLLDLKELAIGIRDEQSQTNNLLQAVHGFIVNQMQPPTNPYGAQPGYAQQGYAQPGYQQGYAQPMYQGQTGGMLQRFLGSGFGRAIEMGAGIGIGEDIINDIF
jgi:type II secretory pathway pseudopilin PulG